MPRILTLTLALLALAPSAAGAAGKTLYAAPNGSDIYECTSANPCDLQSALTMAQAGDEVELAVGDYTLGEQQPSISQDIVVRGPAGAARPRLIGSDGLVMNMTAGTLRDVELVQQSTGQSALVAQDARIERVVVRGSDLSSAARLRGTTVMQSSAVLSPGGNGRGVEVGQSPGGVRLQHLTVQAGSTALVVNGDGSDAHAIVHDSILRGADHDVELVDGISTHASAAIGHSAFRSAKVAGTPEDLGGNLEADPLLATDQFHQQEGSPTLDKGIAAPNGPATDIDGEPRAQGPAPDIGADERAYVPPPPPPEPTPTPSPEPTATPGPQTVPPDPTLPRVLSARFARTPVAGRPSDLVIEVSDSDAAILGVVVDLGPAGHVGLSACRTLKASGPFRPGQPVRFTVPVIFPAPGLQAYVLEIRSGGCAGTQQVTRTEQSTQVKSGALLARTAQAGRCAGSIAPRAGSEARVAAAVVCLMNRERKKRRLRPLKVNRKLVKSARAHTADMLARGYYNHQRPGGPSLKARTRRAKYRGHSGENLGLGSGPIARPAQMMRMWMKSPMHRANVLSRRFRAVGVVVEARDPLKKMRRAAIYTVNFGTRR